MATPCRGLMALFNTLQPWSALSSFVRIYAVASVCSPVAMWAECEAMLYPQSQMPTKNIHCVQHTCSTESPLCGIARTCATLVQHVVIVARARSTREETGRTPSHGNSVGDSLSGSKIALPCHNHVVVVGRRVLHCLERRLQKQRS